MTFKAFIFVLFLFTQPVAYGCGQIAFGQERIITFNLSGFDLPAAMSYSQDNGASSVAPTISTTREEAEAFVQRLLKRTVEDVLYQQGRSAAISDDIISVILQQLDIKVNHSPLKCDKVFNTFLNMGAMMVTNCLIVDGTVTKICFPAAPMVCHMPDNMKPIPAEHLFVSGNLRTSNIIMANWSREMWQLVLNRVLRSLASGQLTSNFYRASISIN